jgi:adenine-specific DNA-methyltransferase
MDRMRMESEDIQQENVKKVAAMFPNCVTEARDEDGHLKKAINFELLKQMLSDSVIDGDEAYEFTWVGKKASIVEANRPIRKTLRPVKADSVHWDTTENLYIEGDNLEVLKLLQESYLGKVKMIYIDPPYNTGHDFVYPDSFIMDNEDYNEGTGYFDEDGNVNYRRENSASAGKYHSDWCSMIYSRLMLARNLLTNDGIIFISIDDNEITNLRKICEEVFGEQNFVAQISLLCNPKGRSQDKYVASCHEYVLIYSNSVLPAGSVSIPKNDDEISKDYSLFDEKGKPYRELELRNTHRDFGKFNRPKMWYPIYVDKDGSVSLDKSQTAEAVYPIWDDGFEGCWTWGIEKAQNEINLLVAKKVNGKTKIYRKAYAYEGGDRPLKQVKSIWNDKRFFTEKGQISFNELLQTKGKLFQSPKSVSMVEQCIQMCQSSEDIVMDFFSGSGTTAHAVMQLNAEDGGHRKFIMVQLPEETDEKSEAFKAGYRNICEIGKERIRRAAKKIHEDNPDAKFDDGFRVLKLDTTNMNDVYYAAGDYDQGMLRLLESNIKSDRTDMDLLFGCLLEWGLPLSLPYTSEIIEGCTVHTYNGGDLIACFDENVPESVIKTIAKRQPLRAVFRDSSFASSPEKINVGEIFKLLAPDTRVKVI